MSPFEYEDVKPVYVQSAPSPGDDGRFDESDRVKSFIQGLRGPSPRAEVGNRAAQTEWPPVAQPPAPLAMLSNAPVAAASVPPVDFFASAHNTGLSRWMDYFSSQNDSVRAREQR